MTLRRAIPLYLVVVHVGFAAVLFVVANGSYWLVAVEAATLLLLATGLTLARRVLKVVDLGDDAERLIREEEFTARLRPVADARVNQLVQVYNRMADTLRAERARIQEQHHFLDQVITASPSGMLILDFDDRIAEANPAALRLLDLGRDAVVGRAVTDLPSSLGAVLGGLEPGAVEVSGAGGTRRVRCHRGGFVDRGFARTFYVLEELTDEARRIERAAYEKLVRVMSHEVNNSVTATNSLLESSLVYTAELTPDSRTDVEYALRIAIDRSTRLNQFMRRFADVFRLPSPVRRPVDLRTLLQQVATLTRAHVRDVEVRCAWPSDAPAVCVDADRDQLEQACLNILRNAVEAAGTGGLVTIDLAGDDDEVVVSIDDSGPGPGEEARAHLFTPFFSTKPLGQGIGLTLVGEILSAHGFAYALDHPAGGPTRFTIRVPRRVEAPAPARRT